MTEWKSLIPNIMVKNVRETLEHYTATYGFSVLSTNPTEGVLEWGYVGLGEVGLMFQEVGSLQEEYPSLATLPVGGALTFYIRVKGIEELYKEVKGKAKVIKALDTTFYGMQEFAVEDINGYILTFSAAKD